MELGLKGKNALVCASSGGIGKAIAFALAKEGANVSILGRDAGRLAKAERELKSAVTGKVLATVCDLAKQNDVDNVFYETLKEFGTIDILINNHGGPKPGSFDKISHADTLEAMDICLYSVLNLSSKCLVEMKKNKWGRIVNILSLSAKEPIPNMFLSNLIRPALLGFTKTVALENAAEGITVNSLLPAAVLSDRTSYFVDKGAQEKGISFDEELENISAGLPAKYIATAEEFAQTAVYLCSENASYVNGTAICVDGGISKALF